MSDHTSVLEAVVPDDIANNTRINTWLSKNFRHVFLSKENTRKSIHRNEISVNGHVAEEAHLLKPGDIVQIRFSQLEQERQQLKSIPVDVKYEDEHLAVAWKPPGQSFSAFEKALAFSLDLKPHNDEQEQPKVYATYSLSKAASGLMIVSKTKQAKEALFRMHKEGKLLLRMRVICHGRVSPDVLATLVDEPLMKGRQQSINEQGEDYATDTMRTVGDMVRQIAIVSETRSNNADYLSTMDVHLVTPLSSLSLRSLFFHKTSHPIVGDSTYTRKLKTGRDKGLYMSLLGVSFPHPFIENQKVNVDYAEPGKFKQLCTREQAFWQRKLDQTLDVMRKAGIHVDASAIAADNTERSQKKPLAYVLGEKEFCQLRFKVTEACLVPRPSSETLVEAAISYLTALGNNAHVLDIGTGCGNLLLSILAHAPHATTGVGIDISKDALAVAQENAKRILGANSKQAEFYLQDMAQLTTPERLYDVVVCNPPYLDSEKQALRLEHGHEPSKAMFAGEQGYAWYTVLSQVVPCLIHKHGRVVLEYGKGMTERVKLIWSGWKVVEIRKDRQGWDRCLVLERT